MDGNTIRRLATDVVGILQRYDIPDNFRRVGPALGRQAREKAIFLLSYSDVALGWRAAGLFARTHTPFPAYLTGDDHWLWKAYLTRCAPELYGDPAIAAARAINDPSMYGVRSSLEAFLLSEDMSHADIGRATGLNPAVVSAYEKLFFNVTDRFGDFLYLAKVVYPNGRLEEVFDGYLNNAPYGDILRRIGYNSGRDYVAYMSGLRSNLLHQMGSGDIALQLERVIMANGFVLAHSGAVNQRADAVGLRAAASLIAAAKHGGSDQFETSGFEDEQVSTALRGEMERQARAGLAKSVAMQYSGFDGNIIDAEMVAPTI